MNNIKSIFLVIFSLLGSTVYSDVASHFNHIKNDPNALYAFFKSMPKGGELHYHLAGGPYPETMLALAAQGNYCLNETTHAMSKISTSCDGVLSKNIFNEPVLYQQIITDWSLKDFIPGKETGHDHFFNGFLKYMPIVIDYRPQLIADTLKRAASQNEQYLELMDIPDDAKSASYGDLIKESQTPDQKRTLLLADKAFQNNINHTVTETNKIHQAAYKELGCLPNSHQPECNIKVKFIYYILREQPLTGFFAQALNAFEAVSRSRGTLVGINVVQAEDGIISLRDYRQQMKIIGYMHQLYPQVNISLHAGELAPESVVTDDLNYHIHDALFTGHAQRIGHGVDIGYEANAEQTLKYMAEKHIPVEVNLISNQKILNISGRDHPLKYYLSHGVPVVLSTDDEGVLRTDLTRQYVEAALNHQLDYQTLKNINRNALTYAFLPGKSIWVDAGKSVLVPQCKELLSIECINFAKLNEKAQLQRNLELQLKEFEDQFKDKK
ncbi:MAG: adenosine deaminase [Legionella sp.]|nr:adenosine deaminase [Legionella sp.]